MLFSGKNIIVTGASGDLGAAITRRLISQGANVLAVASDEARLARLAAEATGPGNLETYVADVTDAEEVLGYATRAFALWGEVDGFVNNAGIQTPRASHRRISRRGLRPGHGRQHPRGVPRDEVRAAAHA
jgi:NAD(P)-dependent dehydrogenase (short-subunit alcohol dehydrogenase family)